MAYVFRTFKTRTDPESGKRVRVLDRAGRPVPHLRWRFEITDYLGRRRVMTPEEISALLAAAPERRRLVWKPLGFQGVMTDRSGDGPMLSRPSSMA